MSYQSPLAKLATNTPKQRYKTPPAPVPEQIRLPDGRQVAVADLVNRSTRPELHNLRSPTPHRPTRKRAETKYTIAERRWQSQASDEEIQERYKISRQQAKNLRYTANCIMKLLERQ